MRIRAIEEKSVAELLGVGASGFGTSPIGQRLAEFADVPLRDLTEWQLAFLLRQRVAAVYLVPLAVERLKHDVWLDAGLYPGDLLLAVARNQGRLGSRKDLEDDIDALLVRAGASLGELDEIDRETALKAFGQADVKLK